MYLINSIFSSVKSFCCFVTNAYSSLCASIHRVGQRIFSHYPKAEEVSTTRRFSKGVSSIDQDRAIQKLTKKREGGLGGPHLQDLILRQKAHLSKLEELARRGGWEHLRSHTSHEASGFDWWMFPITRPSSGYGTRFTVDADQIKRLKKDPAYMRSYRKGVILVAKSWGWDLEEKRDITNENQKWVNYNVRLGKMIDSLQLFGEDDLLKNLFDFIRKKGVFPSLDGWIKRLIENHPFWNS